GGIMRQVGRSHSSLTKEGTQLVATEWSGKHFRLGRTVFLGSFKSRDTARCLRGGNLPTVAECAVGDRIGHVHDQRAVQLVGRGSSALACPMACHTPLKGISASLNATHQPAAPRPATTPYPPPHPPPLPPP